MDGVCVVLEEAVYHLLEGIGEDPDRPGLRGNSLAGWPECLMIFSAELKLIQPKIWKFSRMKGMMKWSSSGIFPYSVCEHHLLPFAGVAHVAYSKGRKNCRTEQNCQAG